MALFYAAISRDSVSYLRFPFVCPVQVFSWNISPVYHLKYPYKYFFSHFCFLIIVVLLILVIILLFWEFFQSALADGFSL